MISVLKPVRIHKTHLARCFTYDNVTLVLKRHPSITQQQVTVFL